MSQNINAPEQLHYRKATLDDLEEISSLVSHAVDVMVDQNILQWDEIYPTKEDFRTDINKHQLYVGLIGRQIAVVFALNQECEEEYKNGRWEHPNVPFYIVHRLCVNPDFQNQGIAKRTLLYIEETLLKMDIHAIRLDAFCNNPYSLKLYDSLHYSRVGYADWRKGRFYLMEKYF